MKLFTIKGVACEPPTTTSVQAKKMAGADVVGMGISTELRPLRALCPTEIQTPTGPLEIMTGELVYVAAAHLAAQRWAKEKFTVDGTEFVIVPADVIFAVGIQDRELSQTPEPSTENR